MTTSKPRVAIIGAGISGLCMAAALERAGVRHFTIYEKADALGGTWRENVYPGAGCDVPSHLYCFSFHPNPDFSRAFAPQSEILAYLNGFADSHQLTSRIRFGVELREARFDAKRAVWTLRATSGETFEAEIVVTATGQLNRPMHPDIPGLSEFRGPVFHSAEWKYDHDLRGERVALIGSGASAVQIVPSIAGLTLRLHVFQRTPSWVIPKADYVYPAAVRAAFRRVPGLLKLNRYLMYWLLEPRFAAFSSGSRLSAWFEKQVRKYMEEQIPDPSMQKKLIPDYPPGCKRILISNEYLPALQRPDVEVVTEHIERIVPDGVVTRDGRTTKVDTIVLATGFEATRFLVPLSVVGPSGVKLEDVWQNGAHAYLGMTVSGFPNLFMLYGPNTNLGHNSIIFMVECQARYVAEMVSELAKGGARSVEVRAERMAAYNDAIQARLSDTVWNAGCSNWYKTDEGKHTNNWPHFTVDYWWRTRHLKRDDFEWTVG
ncbi:MAG TPA: NAD(P)/FAD-dependent oxidoreductase [Polyangiaceae bacterium]|jgi:cation diffusion facilitator CzcD-associated flavoprotein CzcO|nr:NAD(P)/FAD-dependent oxidoreductase [Polyangiaceae bacterium]